MSGQHITDETYLNRPSQGLGPLWPEDGTTGQLPRERGWNVRAHRVYNENSPQDHLSQSVESPTEPSNRILLDEGEVMSWVEVFFERLYSTVPVIDRVELGRDLMAQRHLKDPQFKALIYSLCAFTMMQPVREKERASIGSREARAKLLLDSAARCRASHDFAESPNLVIIITSFFMFATLFNMRLQNASWLRLRESVECARLIGLHRPDSYEGLCPRQISHRLRVYLVLSVTERLARLPSFRYYKAQFF